MNKSSPPVWHAGLALLLCAGVLHPLAAEPLPPVTHSAVVLLDHSGSMKVGWSRPAPLPCAACENPSGLGKPIWRVHQQGLQSALEGLAVAEAEAHGEGPWDWQLMTFDRDVRLRGRWTGGRNETLYGGLIPAMKALEAPFEKPRPEGLVFPNPRGGRGPSARDTDLGFALATALESLPMGGEVFLVTDNLESGVPSGRPDGFYDALRAHPRLSRASVWPVVSTKSCTWLCGASLQIYAFEVMAEGEAQAGGEVSKGHQAQVVWESPPFLNWRAGLPHPAEAPMAPLPLRPQSLALLEARGQGAQVKCPQRVSFQEGFRCDFEVTLYNPQEWVQAPLTQVEVQIGELDWKDNPSWLSRPTEAPEVQWREGSFPMWIRPKSQVHLQGQLNWKKSPMNIPFHDVIKTGIGAFSRYVILQGQMDLRFSNGSGRLAENGFTVAFQKNEQELPMIWREYSAFKLEPIKLPFSVPLANSGRLFWVMLVASVMALGCFYGAWKVLLHFAPWKSFGLKSQEETSDAESRYL